MSTKDIALRCAAAQDPWLLRHRWPSNEAARERYSLTDRKSRPGNMGLIRQLDACKSDEARRLLLGRSK